VIVISDTTPFSELAKIGSLSLLKAVYGHVIIPQEVYDELLAGPQTVVTAVRSASWVEVRSANRQHVVALRDDSGLGFGECAAIILAETSGADRLLLDDLAARKVAQARGLSVTGTIATLLVARQQGHIASVKQALDDLRTHGTRISQKLYLDALAIAGE
jgi:predicted nucleic acid-binding protein